MEILQFFEEREEGIDWDEVLLEAAEEGHLEIIKYILEEKDAVADLTEAINAARNQDVINYLQKQLVENYS